MHSSYQDTDWGAKGGARGAAAAINYHIWAPFGSYFPHMFVFLMQKSAYLKRVVVFSSMLDRIERF